MSKKDKKDEVAKGLMDMRADVGEGDAHRTTSTDAELDAAQAAIEKGKKGRKK